MLHFCGPPSITSRLKQSIMLLPVGPVPSHCGAWLLQEWVVLGHIPESLSQGVKKDFSKSQPFKCRDMQGLFLGLGMWYRSTEPRRVIWTDSLCMPSFIPYRTNAASLQPSLLTTSGQQLNPIELEPLTKPRLHPMELKSLPWRPQAPGPTARSLGLDTAQMWAMSCQLYSLLIQNMSI